MKIVSTWVGKALPLAGGTMTGDLVMSGADILLGANNLKTTNLALKQLSAGEWGMYLTDEATKASLTLSKLNFYGNIAAQGNNLPLSSFASNGAQLLFRARDNGVGFVEIARLQNAADPYFQATLPMVLKPASIPGALVEGHFAYVADEDKLAFYNGVAAQFIASNVTGVWHAFKFSDDGGAQDATRYMGAYIGTGGSSENYKTILLAPEAGILKNLRVRLEANVGGTGQTIVFTVRINGVDTDITVSIATGSKTGSDVAHTAVVAAGDEVTISEVASATSGAYDAVAVLGLG